ncbi:mannose-binding protein [Streptomyces sp. GC420]|uniref:mannose-binding protein n=1 Tax=Streptomyces sp. GC420 TaxID=2697568 RepID=UPI001414F66A|nr:mannose-binding protein [Streptomyces sp. GC420]NBM19049.1 mannose-binding protein [Streptomyces sp. GC420]
MLTPGRTPAAEGPDERAGAAVAPAGPAGGGAAVSAQGQARAEQPGAEPASLPDPAGGQTSPAAGTDEEAEVSPARAAAPAAGGASPPGTADPADSASPRDGLPKKPVLAAAAIVGAVLVAVPFLLVAGGKDEDKRQETAQDVSHEASDTLLDAGTPSGTRNGYATERPSPSPSAKTSEKPAAPAVQAGPGSAPARPKATRSPESRAPSAPSPEAEEKKTEQPRTPAWTSTVVSATSVLSVGRSWSTNRIRMVMQEDGNLVVYNENNNATWASMTFGTGHTARFQADGNLVIHNADDRPIWAAGSYGHEGAKLVLRKDGKVVVMDGGTVVWST